MHGQLELTTELSFINTSRTTLQMLIDGTPVLRSVVVPMGAQLCDVRVEIHDKHGHYGTSSCGNCNERLPEPYYNKKSCGGCGYFFKNMVFSDN